MSSSRALLIAAACVLAAMAAWSTWFWARLPSRLPSDDDYRRVDRLIADRRQAGDIAVLAPAWADRGRQFITAVPAYAGYDLGGDIYPGTRRQWLVALPDVPRFSLGEARNALLGRGSSAAAGERVGELYVEPFNVAGPPVAFSFYDATAAAEVTMGPGAAKCRPYLNGAHQCTPADWAKVQAGWFEMEERPARCIWAHPLDRPPLRITYANVPLPAGGHFSGWGGLLGLTPDTPGGTPVDVAVEVDGRAAGQVSFENRSGRKQFELPLPPSGAAQGTVTFTITSTRSFNRNFCFDAWVQPG